MMGHLFTVGENTKRWVYIDDFRMDYSTDTDCGRAHLIGHYAFTCIGSHALVTRDDGNFSVFRLAIGCDTNYGGDITRTRHRRHDSMDFLRGERNDEYDERRGRDERDSRRIRLHHT